MAQTDIICGVCPALFAVFAIMFAIPTYRDIKLKRVRALTLIFGPVLLAGGIGLWIGMVLGDSGVYGQSDSQNTYNIAIAALVPIASIVGFLALGDCIVRHRELRPWEWVAPAAGLTLLLTPLMLVLRLDSLMLLPPLIVGGVVLAIYGYYMAWSNLGRSMMYLYGSGLVMVAAPLIAFFISEALMRLAEVTVVYHGNTGYVTCHAIALPPDPITWTIRGGLGVQQLIMGWFGYTGMMSFLHGLGRRRMLKKLAAQGHIPPDVAARMRSIPDGTDGMPYAPPEGAEGFFDQKK